MQKLSGYGDPAMKDTLGLLQRPLELGALHSTAAPASSAAGRAKQRDGPCPSPAPAAGSGPCRRPLLPTAAGRKPEGAPSRRPAPRGPSAEAWGVVCAVWCGRGESGERRAEGKCSGGMERVWASALNGEILRAASCAAEQVKSRPPARRDTQLNGYERRQVAQRQTESSVLLPGCAETLRSKFRINTAGTARGWTAVPGGRTGTEHRLTQAPTAHLGTHPSSDCSRATWGRDSHGIAGTSLGAGFPFCSCNTPRTA